MKKAPAATHAILERNTSCRKSELLSLGCWSISRDAIGITGSRTRPCAITKTAIPRYKPLTMPRRNQTANQAAAAGAGEAGAAPPAGGADGVAVGAGFFFAPAPANLPSTSVASFGHILSYVSFPLDTHFL